MFPESWHQLYIEFFGTGRTRWSHAQLVEVAAVALECDGIRALERLRGRLQAIVPGYHETLTCCWLELVRLARESQWDPERISRALSFSQLPFAFYSAERLSSEQAAVCFVAPDLKSVALPGELPAELTTTLSAFQSRQLAKEDWTHACHLRVAAAVYLLLGEAGAHVMATGIQRLNQVHGIPMTPTRGYHETLTRVWFFLVGRAVVNAGLEKDPLSGQRWDRMLRFLDDKELPLRFYSRERIASWEARTGWLAPDLMPLETVDFV